ncbi:MAG: resistance protein [Cycloclasticus sp. symbiont of Poecilosclerida sp. M]|nr:MAG: resistance protein [Cycloclasticus sp. symbiont of Poecilosclerida sp. M]
MSGDYLTNPLVFLISSVIGLYIVVLMVRVLLQATGADFRNPVSRVVINATRLPLQGLRPFFPTVKDLNLAAIVLMLVLQMSVGFIKAGLASGSQLMDQPWPLFIWALVELLDGFINIFIFSIFVVVILSWINPSSHNPAISLLYKISDIILKPLQRAVPPFGAFDLTPIVALFGLQVLKMLLFPPLYALM